MSTTRGALACTLGAIAAIAMSSALAGQPAPRAMHPELVKFLKEQVDLANSVGPVMVDSETRWDTTTLSPGGRVTYFYTLVNSSSKQVDRAKIAASVKSVTLKGVCSTMMMTSMLKGGAVYSYVYAGNDGVKVASFEFTRTDCGL